MLGRCWSGVAVDKRSGELYRRESIKSVPEFADISRQSPSTEDDCSALMDSLRKSKAQHRFYFRFFKRSLSGSGITS